MSKLSVEDIDITSYGNQCSSTKYRSILCRTLVVVLHPSSDAYLSTIDQLTFKKIGEAFEDFKRCNKQGFNVQLRDAVDDIDLVGWIYPFTLLIRGSAEDMNAIEQAWINRMLKSPEGFIIKDFGKYARICRTFVISEKHACRP